jgi:hypothetical protein
MLAAKASQPRRGAVGKRRPPASRDTHAWGTRWSTSHTSRTTRATRRIGRGALPGYPLSISAVYELPQGLGDERQNLIEERNQFTVGFRPEVIRVEVYEEWIDEELRVCAENGIKPVIVPSRHDFGDLRETHQVTISASEDGRNEGTAGNFEDNG